MALYDPVYGVYRKVAKKYDPVDGVYRNVTKAFDPVDGVYRQYFSNGFPASELSVGDSVWLDVDGVLTEFLVVHQGNPDSALYDASCDGTWLLMKDIYLNMGYSSTRYGAAVHTYLNDTWFCLLDSKVQSAIKQVYIPTQSGSGVASGANGLSTKIFVLAGYETGFTTSNQNGMRKDGACLDYFSGATNASRIALYNGVACPWWTRTNLTYNVSFFWYITSAGGVGTVGYFEEFGIRPALILDSATMIAQSKGNNIIA